MNQKHRRNGITCTNEKNKHNMRLNRHSLGSAKTIQRKRARSKMDKDEDTRSVYNENKAILDSLPMWQRLSSGFVGKH